MLVLVLTVLVAEAVVAVALVSVDEIVECVSEVTEKLVIVLV